jgi:putative ABC transport system permease protein
VAGWKPALRLARRDAWRHKGRSTLALVMIALPVLAVTAADVLYLTAEVRGAESLDRRLGTADARITFEAGTGTAAGRVYQSFDPDDGSMSESAGKAGDPVTIATVRSILGRDVPATERRNDWDMRVETERGLVYAEGFELDTASPLVAGLYQLEDGRWPEAVDEVVVSPEVAAKGFPTGAELTVHDGETYTVVGRAESTSYLDSSFVIGPPRSLDVQPEDGITAWHIGGGPVSWDEVQALNAVGAIVLSRAVVENPPPDSELPSQVQQWDGYVDQSWIAVVALVVVMALLEVALLAGPAFAVGARRQSRTLALMAASGGTPKQARRVILAGGLVLGGAAAAVGVVLGIAVGWALLPVVQHFSNEWLGPFDVNPLHLLLIAAFGLVSAFLAAVVPAWIASRQDVVAVLAGRRGDRKPSLRSPLLGLLMVGFGVAVSVAGAKGGGGELAIAASAVVAVLGMILLVPVVLAVIARAGRRLPLVVRYAVRDAARHRTRTVPAVAAVAATVTGVVALGIANSSDAAQNEATYQALLPMGMGHVILPQTGADWQAIEDLIAREAPSLGIRAVRSYDAFRDNQWVDIRLFAPGEREPNGFVDWSQGSFGNVLVGPEALDLATPFDDDDLDDARAMLEQGGLVVYTHHEVDGDTVRIGGEVFDTDGEASEKLKRVELPAYYLRVTGPSPGYAVAAEGALDETGLEASTAGLLIDAHDLSKDQEESLSEAIQGFDVNASIYVERGYQNANETLILLGILFGLGAVLMLGGTLTATFLALSDARPDLATLAAVGAAPRTRRGVAAAYALVVGFVGALLGAAVGFIPGIAVTYPLTSSSWMPGGLDAEGNALPSHFLDVPWLMVLGLVVALPILTAAIVGLFARSRLPLVARVD